MKRISSNKHGQYALFKRGLTDHGGILRNRASGRRARPLATKHSMHLVLRSTQATGRRSFLRTHNAKKIAAIFTKFSAKHSVRILSLVNVGNHLHCRIQLGTRASYRPFIRAVTGAIAFAIGERGRRFWDLRPFTRVIFGRRDERGIEKYFAINRLEASGFDRILARELANEKFKSGFS